ncbi:GNAT family N-acetyltransferase [Bacillus sp. SJS]|uniref:GNAT family N-acetyltransferase n=1 Tax=Bacillus sp. SJS TaxID=1423321 RepID=UPI0004DCE8CD|nr:GNAT family N-acetyltransferase [Bacillus sp. SJS]KZZ83868.1 GNAT family acetyltransferase [Bacillus sp. SJS]
MNITRTKDFELVAKLNRYVHDVHTALYPEYFKAYDYSEIRSFFQRIIETEEFIFLVLEEVGQPLGYAWIEIRNYPENAFKKAYRSVYVHQISIADHMRNQGYGSRLMEEVAEVAKSKGITKVELDYWFDNEAAKIFYRKNNFVKYREFVYMDL